MKVKNKEGKRVGGQERPKKETKKNRKSREQQKRERQKRKSFLPEPPQNTLCANYQLTHA